MRVVLDGRMRLRRPLTPVRWLVLAAFSCGCSGLVQSDACRSYLACTEAVTPGSAAGYESSYGERGACWSTDVKSADQCTLACLQGRQLLAAGAGQGKVECE